MEFFFPGASSAPEAKRLHEELADEVSKLTGWAVAPTGVFAIRYRAQGKEFLAQVGVEHPPYPEETLVKAIFHTPSAFLICTASHGANGNLPIIVSRSLVSDVEYFKGVHDPILRGH